MRSVLNFFKKRRFEILLLVIVVVICLVIAEFFLRSSYPDPYFQNQRYGWIRNQSFSVINSIENNPNEIRFVNVTYGLNGFKRWGDLNTTKKKVLIVGDSFTEMQFVANGEEWYSYLEDEYNESCEFFVFGTGGFGTLQEYLLLEEYYPIIKPDIIIWQFYFNDFQNNDYESERAAYPSSNRDIRPFLQDGKIVYRLALPLAWVRQRSGLAGMSLNIYDETKNTYLKTHRDQFYSQVYGEGFWNKEFSEAKIFGGRFDEVFNITKEIFVIGRNLVGSTPIYFVSADSRLQSYEDELCLAANMTCIRGISNAISVRSKEVNVFVANDGHWNLEGNRIVGMHLVNFFKNDSALD